MKYGLLLLALALVSCKTDKDTPELFSYRSVTVDGAAKFRGVSLQPAIRVSFSAPLNRSSAEKSIRLVNGATEIPLAFTYGALDTTVTVTPKSPLGSITAYKLQVQPGLTSQRNTALNTTLEVALSTAVDTTDKFPVVSDSLLLDLVQKRTLAYFWDFGHPVSGMARERNSSGDVVTSGGTGFGIMAIVAGIHRGFISRKDGLDRIAKIAGFLKNNAKSYHGAFPHWLNGATGETVPFSQKDNGADLVETSYLFQGLLTARQYFNSTSDAGEIALRTAVNDLWDKVEWSWFTKNGENVLYWHWSPTYNWDMNMPIRGWNECLITYVLAASSRTSAVSKAVYDAGWAQNGKMANGNNYYGIKLPLGPANGGPLFFSQYSFLGLDPRQLSDTYARYDEQNSAHTRINYAYCVANPKNYYGYGPNCWGLTASDNASGYSAHSPDNDLGVITPTAALSAMPYTPTESMRALRFFYYKLGDKIFKNYGFVDAFNLTDIWFADSFLAIDQGPVVVMIENHRSQLLWKLFMSCPEVNQGLKNLGFTSPNVKSQTRF